MEVKDFNDPKECLYRAVKESLFKHSHDKIPRAAFDLREKINEKGVSFDRADGREEKKCVDFIHVKLSGKIISLAVEQARASGDILIKHSPSKSNPFHSELEYGTNDGKSLMEIKKNLARFARFVTEGDT